METDLNSELKSSLGSNIEENLQHLLNNPKTFSGPEYFVGKVISNDDGDRMGRCQVRVYGVFGDEVPDGDLPWAVPDNASVNNNQGAFIVPRKNTLVRIYFEHGDIYSPVYTTKILNKNDGGNRERNEDYPNSVMIFQLDNGAYFKINTARNIVTFNSGNGVMMQIDQKGNTEISTQIADEGNITIKAKGDINLQAGKKLIIQTPLGSNNWYPNAMPFCMFTGLPHSLATPGVRVPGVGDYDIVGAQSINPDPKDPTFIVKQPLNNFQYQLEVAAIPAVPDVTSVVIP